MRKGKLWRYLNVGTAAAFVVGGAVGICGLLWGDGFVMRLGFTASILGLAGGATMHLVS